MTLRQTRRYGAALAVLCAAASAAAQVDGQAAWLWEVTTQDGDAIVEPGETATVTLSIDMEPDVGEEMVLGFSGAVWDVLGGLNATAGAIVALSSNTEILSEPGTTDGVNIFGAYAVQNEFDTFVADDPIELMAFEWMPGSSGHYEVEYVTNTMFEDPGTIAVLIGEIPIFDSEVVVWPIQEAAIAFQVVPAPGSVIAVSASVFILVTRPRRVRR